MDTDVCPHVLGADAEYLLLLDPLGVGPLGHHVVRHPLHQVLRHLVQGHELSAQSRSYVMQVKFGNVYVLKLLR
jgi:hypothetical protein